MTIEPYNYGTTKRMPPLSMKQFVLIYLSNLSDQTASRGLYRDYERGLDRLLCIISWEFTEHHPEFKDTYEELMNRNFGEKVDEKTQTQRIREKEELLSKILAKHKISLGEDKIFSYPDAEGYDFSTIIPGEMTQKEVSKHGLSSNDGDEAE